MLHLLSSFPNWLKGSVSAVLGGSLVVSILYYFRDPKLILLILVGVAVAALVVFGIVFFVGWNRRRKGNSNTGRMMSFFSSGDASPEHQRELKALEDKFREGVQKLRELKLNMYEKPWYVIIGEPGSGKTEAIRQCLQAHCPRNLQDPLQGTGGTVNMDWWFTNHAIILDTAGKMTVPDKQEAKSIGSQWNSFLKFMRRYRPNEPINGVFLAIPADSLICDDEAKIMEKSRQICARLGEIQEHLDVRIPVYVMITKADLVVGFREFFQGFVSKAQQDQVFGWCNPEDLDKAFDSTKLHEHMKALIDRLADRRLSLLDQAVADEERRLQAATLYSFPDNLRAASQSLALYLEQIFPPPGPDGRVLGQKPLFVRGVFFISSLQKSAPMDRAVAELLGDSDELQFDEEVLVAKKSYFLNDLFIEKAFKEFGLVTRATNARRDHRMRQFITLGAIILGVFTLMGFTWYGGAKLEKAVGEHRDLWNVSQEESYWSRDGLTWRKIVAPEFKGGPLRYDDWDPVSHGGTKLGTVGYLVQLRDISERPIQISGIFGLSRRGDYNETLLPNMASSHRLLLDASLIRPTIDGARDTMLAPEVEWTDAHTAVLQDLIAIECGVPTGEPRIHWQELFTVLLSEDEFASCRPDLDQVVELVGDAYQEVPWPPAELEVGRCELARQPELRSGLEHFVKYAVDTPELAELQAAIETVTKLQAQFKALTAGSDEPGVQTLQSEVMELTAFETTAFWELDESWLSRIDTVEDFEELSYWQDVAELEKRIAGLQETIGGLRSREEALRTEQKNMLASLARLASIAETVESEDSEARATQEPVASSGSPTTVEEKSETGAKQEEQSEVLRAFDAAMASCAAVMRKRLDALAIAVVAPESASRSASSDAKDLSDDRQSGRRRSAEEEEPTSVREPSCGASLAAEIQAYLNERYTEASTQSLNLDTVAAPIAQVELQLAMFTKALREAEAVEVALRQRFDTVYAVPKKERERDLTVATFAEMEPALAEACKRLQDAKSSAAKTLGDEEKAQAGAARIAELLDVVYRYQGYRIVSQGMTQLADVDIPQLVSERARDFKDDDDDPLPFSDFDSRFHPRAAASVLRMWGKEDDDDSCGGPLLNEREIERLQDNGLENFEDYIGEFSDYWVNEAPDTLRDRARALRVDERFPDLPLLAEEQEYDPVFHPTALKGIRHGFRIVRESVDARGVKELIDDTYWDLLREYLSYWQEFVQRQREPVLETKEWRDCHRELGTLRRRVYRVHDAIEELSQHAREALETALAELNAVEDEELLKAERRDAEQALLILEETDASLESEGFRREIKDLMSNWSDLPTDANRTRAELLKMSVNGFLGDLVGEWEVDRGDLVREYWHSVILAALKSLAEGIDPEAGTCVDQLRRDLGFPVVVPDTGRPTITRMDLRRLERQLNDCSPAEGEEDDTLRTMQVGIRELDRMLVRLRGKGTAQDDTEFLAELRSVMTALRDVKGCVVTLKKPSPGATNGAHLQWHEISFGRAMRIRTTQRADTQLDELRLPGDPFVLELYLVAGSPPDRRFEFSDSWAALRFLFKGEKRAGGHVCRWDSARRSADGERWSVTLYIDDTNGTLRPLELVFDFSAPLPELNTWPNP